MAQEIVGSNMPAKNNYGQNGYSGPSSDTPGKNTTCGFLDGISDADLTAALARVSPKDGRDAIRNASGKGNPPIPKDFKQPKFDAPQTRAVSTDSYPLSFGMNSRTSRSS